jgi:hypothetical protein
MAAWNSCSGRGSSARSSCMASKSWPRSRRTPPVRVGRFRQAQHNGTRAVDRGVSCRAHGDFAVCVAHVSRSRISGRNCCGADAGQPCAKGRHERLAPQPSEASESRHSPMATLHGVWDCHGVRCVGRLFVRPSTNGVHR